MDQSIREIVCEHLSQVGGKPEHELNDAMTLEEVGISGWVKPHTLGNRLMLSMFKMKGRHGADVQIHTTDTVGQLIQSLGGL